MSPSGYLPIRSRGRKITLNGGGEPLIGDAIAELEGRAPIPRSCGPVVDAPHLLAEGTTPHQLPNPDGPAFLHRGLLGVLAPASAKGSSQVQEPPVYS